MVATRLLLMSLLLVCPVLLGCGSHVSQKELGTIVTELPKVPGAEKPYPLPEFGTDEPAEASPVPKVPGAEKSSPLPESGTDEPAGALSVPK